MLMSCIYDDQYDDRHDLASPQRARNDLSRLSPTPDDRLANWVPAYAGNWVPTA